MVDETTDLDRRTFLNRAVAAGATGLGVAGAAGTATARTEPASPGRIDSLLDAHAEGLLSALEAEGLLDRADLPTGESLEFADVVADRPGAAMVSVPGRPTELRVVTDVERGTLSIVVRPTDGQATALLDGSDGRLGYDPDAGWYDFDATASCSCTDEPCPDYPAYLEECCSGSTCTYECKCF